MKKTLSLLLALTFALTITSCGGSKKSTNRQALEGSELNDNLQRLEIRRKYGIKGDTELLSLLESIEIDLKDAGLYFTENPTPQLRPIYEGDKWSARKIRRKTKRAYRWKEKGKGTPKGIVWKMSTDPCEDITYTLDFAPEGSYEVSDVSGLLREYYDISSLYIIETNLNDDNCSEYNKVLQGQQQIGRKYMKSANLNGQRTVERN